jgi:hypothetical protein
MRVKKVRVWFIICTWHLVNDKLLFFYILVWLNRRRKNEAVVSLYFKIHVFLVASAYLPFFDLYCHLFAMKQYEASVVIYMTWHAIYILMRINLPWTRKRNVDCTTLKKDEELSVSYFFFFEVIWERWKALISFLLY